MHSEIAFALLLTAPAPVLGQTIDRLIAVVANEPIFLSDVREAVRLRLFPEGDEARTLERMIDRRLVLAEVARYSQAPPPSAEIDAALREWTLKFAEPPPHDAAFVRAFLTDSLRIDAYVEQRFAALATRDASMRDWLEGLRARAQVRIIR